MTIVNVLLILAAMASFYYAFHAGMQILAHFIVNQGEGVTIHLGYVALFESDRQMKVKRQIAIFIQMVAMLPFLQSMSFAELASASVISGLMMWQVQAGILYSNKVTRWIHLLVSSIATIMNIGYAMGTY